MAKGETRQSDSLKRRIGRLAAKYFPRLSTYRALLFGSDSYLTVTGWRATVAGKHPQDQQGGPLPWMNFAIIGFLRERLRPDFHLFEFGSGYSTLFYSGICSEVIAVEHNEEWFRRVSGMVPDKAKVIYVPLDEKESYPESILRQRKRFDIIVVDGRERVSCVKKGVEALTDRGILILDDSKRERYESAFIFMEEHGFRFIHFEGLKPQGISLERSTLFYREGNCVGL